MSERQVALPTEKTGVQITLICMSRTIVAMWRGLRQIGGSVRSQRGDCRYGVLLAHSVRPLAAVVPAALWGGRVALVRDRAPSLNSRQS
jgi:hypothetical protein